jgi:hypothetical protein
MAKFTGVCPQCHGALQVPLLRFSPTPNWMVGYEIKCPHCKAKLTFPLVARATSIFAAFCVIASIFAAVFWLSHDCGATCRAFLATSWGMVLFVGGLGAVTSFVAVLVSAIVCRRFGVIIQFARHKGG